MNKKKLLEFADWLENEIKPNSFDFTTIFEKTECGSIACAIGWLPEFDDEVKLDVNLKHFSFKNQLSLAYSEVAALAFDISEDDAEYLFTPNLQNYIYGWDNHPTCAQDVTPSQVADAIRHYVEINS